MMYEHAGAEKVMGIIPNDRPITVLDIGPGYGFWGYTLKAHLDHTPHITGVEINHGCYDRLVKLGLYEVLYLGDARTIPDRPFWEDQTFDVAILSHVVEHMEKRDVYRLLDYLRNVCQFVIILCPERKGTSHHVEEGYSHLSAWSIKEFKKMGMHTLKVDYCHRAGRVVSAFERIYFRLKKGRGGVVLAWWDIFNIWAEDRVRLGEYLKAVGHLEGSSS